MRDLINKLERIDERQNWDSLNAVIDQYAKTGMTLQDLAAMEQAARDVDENTGGIGGFFKGIASSESFRVNYVLYHAAEKLGLSTLIGTDGKIRTLDGGSYRAVRASARNVQHRNLAVQQARINLLPQASQSIFSIQQGGANAQLRPTQEFFYTPNARSLQGHSIVRYRGKEPYADMVRQGQQTRVYFEEQYLEQFKAAFPTATVMKADGSGPLEAVATDNTANTATADTTNNDVEVTTLPDQTVTQVYDTLDDFANSNLGGLQNDKEQVPAIRELQTFLTTDLGLDTGTVDGAYGPKTTEAVRQFQSAITGVAVDGNVGPKTIAKIKEVKADVEQLQGIIDSLNESIIPFKSAISKMLEARIDEAEPTDMQKELIQQILGKYENFRNVFPDFKKELFTKASTVIGVTTSNASSDPSDTGTTGGEETDDVETDDVETDDGTTDGDKDRVSSIPGADNTATTDGEDAGEDAGETERKYEVVDGVREYTNLTDPIQDTTLKTGDIIKINGQEAEVYNMPPLNVIFWPGTTVPFEPGGTPPVPDDGNAEDEQTGTLDWMNIQPHDARNRIWKFTVPEDKRNQITGIGVLQDNATVYLRQNQRRGSSVSGWMMARNPGFNAGKPLDSKQDPIVLKLISVLRPLGFDARGAIGLGMDNLGTTGDDILTLWKDAENTFSWDDAKLQDGINRIESREQMLSLLYAYRQQNNGKSLLDEFDDGGTIDDETKQLLNSTFQKFNIPVRVEV